MSKPIILSLSLALIAHSNAQNLKSSKTIPEIQIPHNSTLTVIGNHASHGIVSPTALSLDEKGNIFITETWRFMNERGIDDNRQRRFWIKEDMASQTTADRLALYQKYYHKIKPEYYTNHSEKIRKLTDSNNDGKIDSHTIFADKFNAPLDGTAAGIYSYNGTTYLACIPHIWQLKDKNNDGVADERTSLQEGFGTRVSFSGHDLNGFTFAPDGRLYATIGDRGLNIKTKEGKQWALPGQGAIIRFDPDGSNMEVIHTGLRNPKEIAFDQFGNGITVDNNSDQGDKARIVYIVDQADSGWRMGHQILHSFYDAIDLTERPIDQWSEEKMWETENSQQPAFIIPPIANYTSGPSGLTYDPGVGAHPDYAGKFLICDYRGGAAQSSILSFGIEPKGSSMKFVSPNTFNAGVAATDVEYGYDGSLYVADFIGGWATHQKGRIYKITPDTPTLKNKVKEVKHLIHNGIQNLPTHTLATLLQHPDMRVRLRAQFAIAEKPEAISIFTTALAPENSLLNRLHGIWGLGMLARKNQDSLATAELIKWHQDNHHEVRTQIMKSLAEAAPHKNLTKTLANGLKDKNPRVQFHAALSIGRHKGINLLQETLNYIITSPANAHNRHAGVQALLATSKDLTNTQKHPNEKVRLATVLALRKLKSPALIHSLTDKSTQVFHAAIRAIHDQQLIKLQPSIAKLLDKKSLTLPPMMQHRIIHSAYRCGGAKNIQRLCNFATNKQHHTSLRSEALRLLGTWLTPSTIDHSIGKHAPIKRPNNELKILKETLKSEFESLLNSDQLVVTKAFQLAKTHQLEITAMDTPQLISITQNENLAPSIRNQALNFLTSKSITAGTTEALKLVNHKDPSLALTAIKIITTHAPKSANTTEILLKATKRPEAIVQQQSWLLFKNIKNQTSNKHLAQAINNLTDKSKEHLAAIEIIEAASASNDPSVKSALNNYHKKLNPANPLNKWLPSLHGGNAKSGEQIFLNQGAAQCAKCHNYHYRTVHDGGGNAGPNLAGIAMRLQHHRKDLLEALILPNASIAEGFGTVTAIFEKGQITGKLIAYRPNGIIVQVANKPRLISHDDYKNLIFAKSAMPSMKDKLTLREARDIIEFLSTLNHENGKPPTPEIKATPLNPSEINPDKNTKQIPSTLKQKQLYQANCMACHQQNGEGNLTFPPLAKSEWVSGDKDTLIKIILQGLTGPIKVRGKLYDGIPMPNNARLSNEDIANILTFIRTNPTWANNASKITPEEVAKVRKKITTPNAPLDATKLKHPHSYKKSTKTKKENN